MTTSPPLLRWKPAYWKCCWSPWTDSVWNPKHNFLFAPPLLKFMLKTHRPLWCHKGHWHGSLVNTTQHYITPQVCFSSEEAHPRSFQVNISTFPAGRKPHGVKTLLVPEKPPRWHCNSAAIGPGASEHSALGQTPSGRAGLLLQQRVTAHVLPDLPVTLTSPWTLRNQV